MEGVSPAAAPPLALATSVTDFRFLWRFWRWTANTACYARQHDLPYYVFVGTPLKRATKRSAATTCPARKEELLGHTSKALSLHALTSLDVADRVLFLDARHLDRAPCAAPVPPRGRRRRGRRPAGALLPPALRRRRRARAVDAVGRRLPGHVVRAALRPEDQPSLWHLVLRAAGLDGAAEEVRSTTTSGASSTAR